MHILITGHTGFKGSWLTVLLTKLGHEVSGLSLEAVKGGAFDLAQLEDTLKTHQICDVRDKAQVVTSVKSMSPDVVVHMAAQPLVIEGYRDPLGTMETNVSGTLNVLEACRTTESVKAVLVVTTDKVYKDKGHGNYSEGDELGGFDPYSASKAMADLLAQSYGNLESNFKIGIARAGNVIGLGDVSPNRLIPDIASAFLRGERLIVRHPNAVRPWQHVLDCLYGYVLTLDKLSVGLDLESEPMVLNFGPEPHGYKSVAEVIAQSQKVLGEFPVALGSATVKETSFLTLNSSNARSLLGWRDKLDFESAIAWSLESIDTGLTRELMQKQVSRYLEL
jgi:CDP-glucose 4,6-dehydratase